MDLRCRLNHLQLNTGKTKESVVDFNRRKTPPTPVSIQEMDVDTAPHSGYTYGYCILSIGYTFTLMFYFVYLHSICLHSFPTLYCNCCKIISLGINEIISYLIVSLLTTHEVHYVHIIFTHSVLTLRLL